MRLHRKAGETLFDDYAGQIVLIVNPQTGDFRQAQFLVAVRAASCYPVQSRDCVPTPQPAGINTLPIWIGAHARMFQFLDGTPEVLVPDKRKAGKHPCRYEPNINPTYHDLAHQNRAAVVLAHVSKSKEKAKVEVCMQVVERWILSRLRDCKGPNFCTS